MGIARGGDLTSGEPISMGADGAQDIRSPDEVADEENF